MDKASTRRELVRGNMVERRVHDVIAEKLTSRVGCRHIELDVGEQFYNLGYGQRRLIGLRSTSHDRLAMWLIAVIVPTLRGATAVDRDTLNTHANWLTLTEIEYNIGA